MNVLEEKVYLEVQRMTFLTRLVTWYIGRVKIIRNKDGNRVFDYHNDIDLLDRPKVVDVQCCRYNRIKGKHMYKYHSIDHLFIQLEYFIATTNLS